MNFGKSWRLGAAYLALAATVYALLPAGTHTAGDAVGYLAPARQFMEGGGLDTSLRLPGYPLLLAGLMALGPIVPLAVALQTGLLWATGLVMQRLADDLTSGPAVASGSRPGSMRFPWVLALTVFNPVAVFMAQSLLPDTLFASLVAVHIRQLLRFMRTGSLQAALLAGLAAGLGGLVRANGVHLLLVAPVLLAMACALCGRARGLRPLLPGLLLLVVAGAGVLAPQLAHMHSTTGRWALYSPEYGSYAVHENLAMLAARAEGVDAMAGRASIHARTMRLEGMTPEQWAGLTWVPRNERVASRAWELAAGYGPAALTRAVAHGLAVYLLDGGTSLWLGGLGITQLSARDAMAVLAGLNWGAHWVNLLAWGLPIGFVLATRLAALPALADVLWLRGAGDRAQYRAQWLVVLGYVTYFAVVAAFLGNARYRLPSEGLLFLLAAHGAGVLRRSRRAGPRT